MSAGVTLGQGGGAAPSPPIARFRASMPDSIDWMVGRGMSDRRIIRHITGQADAGDAADRGTEFHAAMEHWARTGEDPEEWLTAEGRRFTWRYGLFDDIGDVEVEVPDIVEAHRTRPFRSWSGRQWELSGHIDALCGRTIVDYKTTAAPLWSENYLTRFQHHLYLSLWPEADRFRYHVFRLFGGRGPEDPIWAQRQLRVEAVRSERMIRGAMRRVRELCQWLEDLEERGELLLTPEGCKPPGRKPEDEAQEAPELGRAA